MSTIRRPKSSSRSPGRDSNKNKFKNSNFSTENLPYYEDSLVNSQRNSEASILIQKRNSDVNFLLDDGEEEREVTSLTRRHKGAIRAIRKLQYLVAKRKFREALKPYDIKDVIESYSAGHSDLVFKVKGLQSRLDLILGQAGSKTKDVYESKTSLASRIVNVERTVDSIEEKLQIFIELYHEDRKRFTRQDETPLESGMGREQFDEGQEDSNESTEATHQNNTNTSNNTTIPHTPTLDSNTRDSRDSLGSLPQGLELFTIVTEQEKRANVHQERNNKIKSYNL